MLTQLKSLIKIIYCFKSRKFINLKGSNKFRHGDRKTMVKKSVKYKEKSKTLVSELLLYIINYSPNRTSGPCSLEHFFREVYDN